MKRLSEYLVVAAVLTFVIAIGCGPKPGPEPDPTPVPEPTSVPVPTEVPTPVAARPCVQNPGVGGVWSGDCAASDTCRDGHDGFFYGASCKTVTP